MYYSRKYWFYNYCSKKGEMKIIWTCHICNKERPDSCISVHKKPIVFDGKVVGQQNIRYCNDNSACFVGAKSFSSYK